jgi:hypothetical protein
MKQGTKMTEKFAQIQAYQQLFALADQTSNAEIAIHWIDRATVEVKNGSFQLD